MTNQRSDFKAFFFICCPSRKSLNQMVFSFLQTFAANNIYLLTENRDDYIKRKKKKTLLGGFAFAAMLKLLFFYQTIAKLVFPDVIQIHRI